MGLDHMVELVLVVYKDIIVRGTRIIVPASLQHNYAQKLHKGHPGLEATKSRARQLAYWPNMNHDIENVVSMCGTCNSQKHKQQKEPMLLHDIPETPWQIVATDLFTWNGNS